MVDQISLNLPNSYGDISKNAQAVNFQLPSDEKSNDKTIAKSEQAKPATECQTCKNRKYQDGSNEMVSFKTAQKISPNAAASRVRAHEQEHVLNAYNKATEKNGKVLQASVMLKTAICPECGRAYVSGGVTHTRIQYSNKDNPYAQNREASLQDAITGSNIDINS